MPHEQRQPLTLESVVRLAKQVILRDGHHQPALIADGDRRRVVTWIEPMGTTHDARVLQMIVMGEVLAEQGDLGVLRQVFLITEAWMSIAAADQPLRLAPSQDPQRKEVLVVSQLAIRPPQTELVLFEMKRDRQGKLTKLETLDLQIKDDPSTHAESPLLEAFAIGFLGSAWRTDGEENNV